MLPSQFKRIEQLIICGICYEYIETCVMTPCSHNYCSLCIRKYLHYKTECPICFEETFEKDLRVNKALDEIVLCVLDIKDNIPKCINTENTQIIPKNLPESNVIDKTPCTPKQISNVKTSCSNKETSKNDCTSISEAKAASPFAQKVTEQVLLSPSTSAQTKVHSIFTPKSKKSQQDIQKSSPVNNKTVTCPVCKVDVSEVNINRHLDDCLKRQDGISLVPKPQPKRKPLPKLVFSLMKDAELRKKLKEMKLSAQGDRKVLEARLQRYITLYNAECDKSNPRPVLELIKQCEEEEFLEKKVQKSSTVKLQINRNTEQNVIEEAQKKYLEANKDSFASLIAKAKSTTTPKKPIARRSIFEQSPRKKQAVSNDDVTDDTETSDFAPFECNDYLDMDSDTEVFCPLQTYSSEDPRRFLAVTMSDATSDDAPKEPVSFDEKKYMSPVRKPSFPSPSSPYRNTEMSKRDISAPLDRSISPRRNSNHNNASSPARSKPSFSFHDNSRSSFSLHSPAGSPLKPSTASDNNPNSHYYSPQSRSRTTSTSSSYKHISTIPDEDAKSSDSEASESDFVNVSISPVIQTRNTSSSVKSKTRAKVLFQKKTNLSLKKIVEDPDSLDSFASNFKSDDLQERHSSCNSNLRDSILKDFLDELSSSDSTSSKFTYDKTSDKDSECHNIQREVLSDNISDYTKLEKENVNSVTENAVIRRPVRKRIRETNVTGDENSPKRERRTRKVLNPSSGGSKELSKGGTHVVPSDRGKKLPNTLTPEEVESIPAIVNNDMAASRRKSTRTRNKNANTLGSNNNDAG